MPYQPTVNDISGQIYGQNMSSLGNQFFQAAQMYKQKTDEDKLHQAKLKSVENLIDKHADEFGMSEEEKKMALSVNPKESPMERYARLGGYVENAVIGNKMKQMAAQQQQLAQQQAAGQDLVNLSKYSQGQGIGVYAPGMQKKMQAQLADPMTQSAMRLRELTGQTPDAKELIAAQAANVKENKPMMKFSSVKALQDKYPGTQYDYNFLENPDGSVSVDKISPRAPVAGQIEPGYEPDPTQAGAIRPIQGSSAWQKAQDEKQNKQDSVRILKDRASTITNTVDEVLPKVNGLTSGFGGTVLSKIPATESNDVRKTIQTIKSALSVEQLQQMRAASKNGASGFGQLSERELGVIETSIANLDQDQSPEQLAKNLNKIKTHFDRFKMTLDGIDPDAKNKGVKLPTGWSIK